MQERAGDPSDVMIRAELSGMLTGFVPTNALASGHVLEMLQTGARGAWVGTFLALVLIAVFSIPDIIRRPVVAASIGVLVSDFFLTKLFMAIG